jgi:hypothetical protein
VNMRTCSYDIATHIRLYLHETYKTSSEETTLTRSSVRDDNLNINFSEVELEELGEFK